LQHPGQKIVTEENNIAIKRNLIFFISLRLEVIKYVYGKKLEELAQWGTGKSKSKYREVWSVSQEILT